jgi:hypothetical protein
VNNDLDHFQMKGRNPSSGSSSAEMKCTHHFDKRSHENVNKKS